MNKRGESPPLAAAARVPNVYNYCKRLEADARSLDEAVQATQQEHDELLAKLARIQEAKAAKAHRELEERQREWEHEREKHVDAVVRGGDAVARLQRRQQELDTMELALQAELEVLHEQQQLELMTEARRIEQLVHNNSHYLEDQLVKGKMDLDYLTQLISSRRPTSPRLQLSARDLQDDSKAVIAALTQDVKKQRRQEFDQALARFRARLHECEEERERLKHQVDEIKWKRQRALQVLSKTQQQVIHSFFSSSTAPPSARTVDASIATLNFGAIMRSLNQSEDQSRNDGQPSQPESARKSARSALEEAHQITEIGPARVLALEQSIAKRHQEAAALGVGLPEWSYDGRWGIESYTMGQFPIVYYTRDLVFSWADTAVEAAETKPSLDVLEAELERWQLTHAMMEQKEREQTHHWTCLQLLDELWQEVVREACSDVLQELQSLSIRIQTSAFTSVFQDVFFPTAATATASAVSNSAKQPKAPTAGSTSGGSAPSLRLDMLTSSFEFMRRNHARDPSIHNEHNRLALLHQLTLPIRAAPSPAPTSEKSTKATKANKNSAAVETTTTTKRTSVTTLPAAPSGINSTQRDIITIKLHQTTGGSSSAVEMPAGGEDLEKQRWTFMQRDMTVVAVPPPYGRPCCSQLSPTGNALAVATVDGELLVWSLAGSSPVLTRVLAPPPKQHRCRVIKLQFSTNQTRLLTMNVNKLVGVWSLHSAGTDSVSADAFLPDATKYKPTPIELLLEINPDALARPSYERDVIDTVTKAKSQASTGSAQVMSAVLSYPVDSTGNEAGVLCGLGTGDVVKFSLTSALTAARTVLLGPSEAPFDAPRPSDVHLRGRDSTSNGIQREFFQGHQQPVLFLGHASWSERGNAVVWSVDQERIALVWEYHTDHFAGFGWFRPIGRYRLDWGQQDAAEAGAVSKSLASSVSSSKQKAAKDRQATVVTPTSVGELQQLVITADGGRLVLMVWLDGGLKRGTPPAGGSLRFYQLDLCQRVALPFAINMDCPGLTSDMVRCAVIPVLQESSRLGQLVVLTGTILRIHSLVSGVELTTIAITGSAPPAKSSTASDSVPTLTGLCTQSLPGKHNNFRVALLHEQQTKTIVFKFTPPP